MSLLPPCAERTVRLRRSTPIEGEQLITRRERNLLYENASGHPSHEDNAIKMERRRLLFLTNFEHGWREEDDFLLREASVRFGKFGVELTACHPSDAHDFADGSTGVIIRNVWPTHEYLVVWHTPAYPQTSRLLSDAPKIDFPMLKTYRGDYHPECRERLGTEP